MKRLMFSILAVVLLLALVIPMPVIAKSPVPVWHVPGDFATIQEAIDSSDVNDGDIIIVGPGTFAGANVTKSLTLKGTGGTVIDDGPNSNAFLRAGFLFNEDYSGNGAKISGFTFICEPQTSYVDDGKLDLPIFSRGADDVTVERNKMINSLQAITDWHGSGWKISNNEITDLYTLNGGGIGILIGARNGSTVQDNMVSHNRINGILNVWESDGGGYNGSGIVLYADFRGSNAGAEAIKNNRIFNNKVSLASDTPEVVDVIAFEMTDTRDDTAADPYPVIFDNAVGCNDFRGTALQIDLTPDDLENYNDISCEPGDNRWHDSHRHGFRSGDDFGDNRGHNLHSHVFGP